MSSGGSLSHRESFDGGRKRMAITGRVKDGGKLLDAINQSWAGATEIGQRIDQVDRASFYGRKALPSGMVDQ